MCAFHSQVSFCNRGRKAAERCQIKNFLSSKASCAVLVVSFPPKSQPNQHQWGHHTPKSPVTINSSLNSILGPLIPVKVNCCESFHISGRGGHLRLGTSVWAALHWTTLNCDTTGLYKPGLMVTNFFDIIKTLFYFDCSLGHGRS